MASGSKILTRDLREPLLEDLRHRRVFLSSHDRLEKPRWRSTVSGHRIGTILLI